MAYLSEFKLARLLELGRKGNVTPTQIGLRLGIAASYVRRYLIANGIEPVKEKNLYPDIVSKKAPKAPRKPSNP